MLGIGRKFCTQAKIQALSEFNSLSYPTDCKQDLLVSPGKEAFSLL